MSKALFVPLQISLGTVFCLSASPILAQIASDGTVNTQVNQNGNVSEITGGETRGGNLFHSFQDFSVQTGNEAFFNNADSIANIFSRVTGGNVSNIDGLIRANGSASLFLINPNGIVFGENARLDIGGSFYGSSASSILFEDGEFSAADLDNPPLLTVNAPIGLNLRDAPGDITIRGDGNGARFPDSEVIDTQDALRVNENATIGFLGGNVLFEDATVKTAGGRIEIGSVAEGTVNLIDVDNGFTFDYSAIETFQNISLSGTSIIDPSGIGGGDIQAAGNNISISGVSGFTSFTLGSIPGEDINIFAAESLNISGVENELNFVSAISSTAFPNSTADAGNINIETGSLSIGDRAVIDTGVSGRGNAGNININASESTTLTSQGNVSAIFSGVNFGALGNGGDVNLSTDSLTLSNEASINTTSSGLGRGGNLDITTNSLNLDNAASLLSGNTADNEAGNVIINATENVSFSNNSQIFVSGSPGGFINLSARNLSITSGSNFFAGTIGETSSSQVQAGNIVINLQEDLVLDGLDSNSSTTISNSSTGTGNPGNIEIDARNITFQNGGNIFVFFAGQDATSIGNIILNATDDVVFDGIRTIRRSGISNVIPENLSGSIGDINLTAKNLTITSGAQISSLVNGTGDSGNINLNIADSILIDGFSNPDTDSSISILPSQIASDIFGTGDAGTINIDTQNLELSRNGRISANISGVGNGGNININAEQVSISEPGNTSLTPSSIEAQFFGNIEGDGGNITLQVREDITLQDGGSIFARAFNQGNGGNLSIDSRFIIAFPNGNNDITASAEQGQGGNITIDAESLFGIQERTLSNLTNDINASSQVSGLDGTINITNPDVNPVRGATELPTSVVVPEETTQQACAANREVAAGNGLNIAGKGGVPPAPELPLNSLNPINSETNSTLDIPAPIETSQGKIQLARGIEVSETGEIRLVAYRTNNAGSRIPEIKPNCDRL